MNLKEFAKRVNEIVRVAEMQHKDVENIDVKIYVKVVGTVGPLPTVDIKHIGIGVDWDSGRCIITPEKDLRETTRDEISAIKRNSMIWGGHTTKQQKH
jgi:hypothetical protein